MLREIFTVYAKTILVKNAYLLGAPDVSASANGEERLV